MSKRVYFIDAWRGVALFLMLAYHFCFDLVVFNVMRWDTFFSTPLNCIQHFIAYTFILCSGISCCLSRNNIKRGFVCALAGLAVVIGAYIVEEPILFGVLQFLSFAMIFYGLFGKWLDKIPEKTAPFLWLFLFVCTSYWTKNAMVGNHWIFWLGFKYEGFYSADYYPLLPNIFLFFLGTWMGKIIQKHRDDWRFLTLHYPVVLTWTGSHTLWIYLLHQPLLYALCLLIF